MVKIKIFESSLDDFAEKWNSCKPLTERGLYKVIPEVGMAQWLEGRLWLVRLRLALQLDAGFKPLKFRLVAPLLNLVLQFWCKINL